MLKPDGGVDWRIVLDPQTALPKTMVHQEGDQTVTVTFNEYETVDGVKFEKEILYEPLTTSGARLARGAI